MIDTLFLKTKLSRNDTNWLWHLSPKIQRIELVVEALQTTIYSELEQNSFLYRKMIFGEFFFMNFLYNTQCKWYKLHNGHLKVSIHRRGEVVGETTRLKLRNLKKRSITCCCWPLARAPVSFFQRKLFALAIISLLER